MHHPALARVRVTIRAVSKWLVSTAGRCAVTAEMPTRDHVDGILGDWAQERPDVDVAPMAVVARISRAARYLERGIDTTLRRYDLSHTSFNVLAALRRSGPPYRLSPTDLHDALLISSGAVTNRLDRVEAGGFTLREPAPYDRRGVLVRLTEKGLTVVNEVLAAHVGNEARMLTSLTENQRESLASCCVGCCRHGTPLRRMSTYPTLRTGGDADITRIEALDESRSRGSSVCGESACKSRGPKKESVRPVINSKVNGRRRTIRAWADAIPTRGFRTVSEDVNN